MALFRSKRIRRTRDGRFELRLPAEERQLLATLAPQLKALIEEEGGEPSLRRLFPTAYANDAEADAEYQRLMRDDLVASRLATLDIVVETATQTSVSEDELVAWMSAINALRLVLGTRLDVSETLDIEQEVADDHPMASAYAVYGWLSFVLEEIVAALSS